MAARRPRRRKKQRGCLVWLLVPLLILAAMAAWLYRNELMDLASFRFRGIDFTRPPGEAPPPDEGVTEKERKELEKILEGR